MCKIFGKKTPEYKQISLEERLKKIEESISEIYDKIERIHYLMECKEYTTLYPNSIYYNIELSEYQEQGYKLKKIFKNGSQLWVKEMKSSPAMDAKKK